MLKSNFVQLTIGGKPFSLDNTHPTFKKLTKALKDKDWAKVPKLISVVEQIMDESGGSVTVHNGTVLYKGREVHNTLAQKIVDLANNNLPVTHMIQFMENLYRNPSDKAKQEFYDFLVGNDLPITDDGEYLCYKSVREDNTDTHSGKVDNSVGKIVLMRRKAGDENWRIQCSSGFHVCSKKYGVYGDKQMLVKVNPRDVLSAVDGKMRVVRYEVIAELGKMRPDLFQTQGYLNLENKLVVRLAKTKQELLKKVFSLAVVKRGIKNRKFSKRKIEKMSLGRLTKFLMKIKPQKQVVKPADIKNGNDLEGLRKNSGLTRGQIAKKLKITLKELLTMESRTYVSEVDRDNYLEAVLGLKGESLDSDVSFKKAV